MSNDFIWRLRLEHEGAASIRATRPGRTLRFDPVTPPASEDIVVLTWDEHERVAATAQALRDGRRPMVIAPEPVLQWLAQRGVVEGAPAPVVDLMEALKASLAAAQPDAGDDARKAS